MSPKKEDDVISALEHAVDAALAHRKSLIEELAAIDVQLAKLGHAPPAKAPAKRTAVPTGETASKILEYVASHPGSSGGDIAKHVGRQANQVSPTLTRLVRSKQLKRRDRKYYPAS